MDELTLSGMIASFPGAALIPGFGPMGGAGGDPIDGIPGLVQRFESAFPEDFLTDGGVPAGDFEPVEEILNRTGGPSTLQADEEKQLLWLEDQLNGFGAIESDGIDDSMLGGPSDSDDQTVYVLARMLATGGGRAFGYQNARSVGGFGVAGSFGFYSADGGVGTFDATQASTDWRLVGVHLDGANLTGESDGVAASFTANILSTGQPGLVLADSGASEYGWCQIAGVWRWNRTLTEPERVIVRQYVLDTYNVG